MFLLGCEKTEIAQYDKMGSPPAAAAPQREEVNASLVEVLPEDQSTPKRIDTISKKIIKNGTLDLQVANIKNSQAKVSENIKKFGAYVQQEEFNNSEVEERLFMTIRVPHKNFDSMMNSFSSGDIGNVLSKTVSTDDVTEDYTDTAIRLANKKIYLDKYRDLLTKAANTKDMLEIQEKIRGLEEEIESAEGKLRYIDDRVNYSTLRLNLIKEKPRESLTSKIGFGSRFMDSIAQGWNSFVSFLLGAISFWPFFILIPAAIFAWRKFKNRKRNKNNEL